MTGKRRFYREATADPVEGGYRICLDGRPVRTPAKARFQVPDLAIAQAIAAEWAAQGDEIDPASMPLTQLANTAIDRVGPQRQAVIDSVAAYAQTDLLCHWAERPAALVARQQAAWQPLLDWAAADLDAPLRATAGILPVAQPEAAIAALRARIAGFDDLQLAGIAQAVGLLGSLVLALALARGRIDAEAAFAAAHLDEIHQLETWGEDDEARDRLDRRRAEIGVAGRFFAMLER
ncbi:MAG: ATPase [Inquilinus sp.]|nr:ATPase [Inquilinus sp.]